LKTGAADPDGVLGRLGQLGLTKVAVHPDDLGSGLIPRARR
jgi:hypothetical protein